ncbi:hypothetical protein ACLBOM_36450 [Escherichia coli]
MNGERSCIHLSLSLQQTVQRCLPDGMPEYQWDYVKLSFLERASQTLRIFPARESEHSAIRRAYQKRDLMVQRLGFVSLMRLKALWLVIFHENTQTVQAYGKRITCTVNATIFNRYGDADDFLDSQEIKHVY